MLLLGMNSKIKRHPWGVFSFVIFGVIFIYFTLHIPPDTETLRKNPETFRFDYAYSSKSMREALESIIFEGMTREKLEEIFVNSARATVRQSEKERAFVYSKKRPWFTSCLIQQGEPTWNFRIEYDEKMRVTYLQDSSNEPKLFELSPLCF